MNLIYIAALKSKNNTTVCIKLYRTGDKPALVFFYDFGVNSCNLAKLLALHLFLYDTNLDTDSPTTAFMDSDSLVFEYENYLNKDDPNYNKTKHMKPWERLCGDIQKFTSFTVSNTGMLTISARDTLKQHFAIAT